MKTIPNSRIIGIALGFVSSVKRRATVLVGRCRAVSLLLSAVVLFGVSNSSIAETTVGGGWPDLTFTLQDLDPSDGIAPSIHTTGLATSMAPASYGGTLWYHYPVAADYLPQSDVDYFGVTETPFELDPHNTIYGDLVWSFELSAHTSLTASGTAFVFSTGPASTTRTYPDGSYQVGETWGNISFGAFNVQLTSIPNTIAARYEQSFSDAVQNSTDAPSAYAWQIAGIDGGAHHGPIADFAAPVPEPETYALMLAGLGTLRLVSRRRKGGTAAASEAR